MLRPRRFDSVGSQLTWRATASVVAPRVNWPEKEVSVEYPAPPAVANAYLNATYTKQQLNAKRRGCIVSQIADNHAKDSKYGPKGGPHNTDEIEDDAEYYFLNCPS